MIFDKITITARYGKKSGKPIECDGIEITKESVKFYRLDNRGYRTLTRTFKKESLERMTSLSVKFKRSKK